LIRNVGSNALLNIYRTGLQFALQLILTHFVLPEEYGLVALIAPVTLLVLMIGDFGLTSAIVRSPEVSMSALGGAMRVSALTGAAVILATLTATATGLLDRVAPHFGLLSLGFSVVVTFSLLSAVPRALFERRLSYGRIAAIESTVTTISFAVAFGAAWAGAGLWSYLCYHIVVQGLRLVAMAWEQRGRLNVASGSIRAALPLLGIGGWVLASNIIGFVARNGDNYIVAYILGSAALGIYSLAYQVMLLPVQTLTWPISSVLTATLSRLTSRPDLQRGAMLATMEVVAYISIPAGVFMLARAPIILNLLFSQHWQSVGDVAARLALAGCIQSITSFNGALLVAQGRFRLQLWIAVANTLLVLGTVTAAALLGGELVKVADAYLALVVVTGVGYLWPQPLV
jgi:O-antigen/teichoic acid export membrane protein